MLRYQKRDHSSMCAVWGRIDIFNVYKVCNVFHAFLFASTHAYASYLTLFFLVLVFFLSRVEFTAPSFRSR